MFEYMDKLVAAGKCKEDPEILVIGWQIRTLRRGLRLKRSEFSIQLGCSEDQLTAIENGFGFKEDADKLLASVRLLVDRDNELPQ